MLEQCLYISPLLLHSCACIWFCGANYLLFQWVHEAFCLCCPLNKWCWAHNIGFPMPSMAKNWILLMGPPHRNIAPRLPLPFFTQMLAFPTWNLLFCSPDFLHSCSVNYVRFFPPEETGVRESVKEKKTSTITLRNTFGTPVPLTALLVVTQP